jgi:hypothetical protein
MTRLSRLRRRLKATSPTDQAVRIALGLMLLSGAVAGTSASFNASTSEASPSGLGTDALYAPASLAATPSGNDVVVTWPVGSLGSGATTFGHQVAERSLGVGSADGLTSPACSETDAFTTSTTGTNATLSFTDIGVATATGNQGAWYCYRVQTTYPQVTPLWFSQVANPVAKVQIGHVMRTVELVNGNGTAGNLGTGDSVVMTFNQPVDTATGPTTQLICARTNNDTINIGRSGTGACGNSETVVVGKIVVNTVASNATWNTSWMWSDCPVANQCRTLTATLGSATNGTTTNITLGATPSMTPVTGFNRSAAGNVSPCIQTNSTARMCRPTPFGAV